MSESAGGVVRSWAVALVIVAVSVVLAAVAGVLTVALTAGSSAAPTPTTVEPGTEAPAGASPQPGEPAPAPAPGNERAEVLAQQRALLRDGVVGYSVPPEMEQGEWYRVTVAIAYAADRPLLSPSPDGVVESDVPVGSDLVADLTAPPGDFEIARVGADDGARTLVDGDLARWQWDVRPLRSGDRGLDLSVYVRVADPEGAPTAVRTFARRIQVGTGYVYSAVRFVRDYWQLTGLTIPVVAGGVTALVLRRRRRPDAVPAAPEPERSTHSGYL